MAAKHSKKKSTKKNNPTNKKKTPIATTPNATPAQKTSSETATNAASSSWLLTLGAGIAIAILTALVYQGMLDNQFVDWDDYTYVIENDLVRPIENIRKGAVLKGQQFAYTATEHSSSIGDVFGRSVSLNYHPLTMLSMRWNNNNCQTCELGIAPRPFLSTNLWLHCLNSILVLLLIYWLSKKNLLLSIFVALIFALHPMHVESVAWISERKDVLYTFFFLLGLLSYGQYLEKGGARWWLATFALFVAACLSKAMAVVFPVVLLLLYLWHKAPKGWQGISASLSPKVWLPLLPFFLLSLILGIIAVDVQAGGNAAGLLAKSGDNIAINKFDDFSFLQRIQFASYGFLQYLIKFFVPVDLSPYYPYPDQTTYESSFFFKLAPLLVTLLLGIAVWSLKYRKYFFVGLFFYAITIALVLQFISVGAVIMADRYTYLPYIGVAFALGMAVQHWVPTKQQSLAYMGLIGFAFALSPLTIQQIEVWQNSETLWTSAIELQQGADGNLTSAMVEPLGIRGAYYGKMAERAQNKQDKKRYEAYSKKALQDLSAAVNLGTRKVDVYENLGILYGIQGNYKKAFETYEKGLALDPTNGNIYLNRGIANSILRNHEAAIKDYTAALQYSPVEAQGAYFNRGVSYSETGQRQKAIADFEMALRINPQHELAKRFYQQLTQNGR